MLHWPQSLQGSRSFILALHQGPKIPLTLDAIVMKSRTSSMKPLKTHQIATVKENETDKEMPNKSILLPHNFYAMPSHRRYPIKPPSLNPGANTWWLDKKTNSTLRVDWLVFNPLFPRNATEPMNHPPSWKGWCDESKVLQNLIVSMIVMTYVTTEPSKN